MKHSWKKDQIAPTKYPFHCIAKKYRKCKQAIGQKKNIKPNKSKRNDCWTQTCVDHLLFLRSLWEPYPSLAHFPNRVGDWEESRRLLLGEGDLEVRDGLWRSHLDSLRRGDLEEDEDLRLRCLEEERRLRDLELDLECLLRDLELDLERLLWADLDLDFRFWFFFPWDLERLLDPAAGTSSVFLASAIVIGYLVLMSSAFWAALSSMPGREKLWWYSR